MGKMELENLKKDLLAIINHYGKTIPIGPLFYVVKDVARDVGDAYNQWLETTSNETPKEPEGEAPAEQASGEVVE